MSLSNRRDKEALFWLLSISFHFYFPALCLFTLHYSHYILLKQMQYFGFQLFLFNLYFLASVSLSLLQISRSLTTFSYKRRTILAFSCFFLTSIFQLSVSLSLFFSTLSFSHYILLKQKHYFGFQLFLLTFFFQLSVSLFLLHITRSLTIFCYKRSTVLAFLYFFQPLFSSSLSLSLQSSLLVLSLYFVIKKYCVCFSLFIQPLFSRSLSLNLSLLHITRSLTIFC